MFSNEDLKCLDPEYFSIITTDAYDVTIMSRNTGHYWYLHNPEYPERGTVIIFHKHKASHPYRLPQGEHPAAGGTEHPGA